MPQNGHGVEVLGTLALVAPKIEEFQFVKVKVEGEVARITLDRPDHNLLNERMLAELTSAINTLGERNEIKLMVLDSAVKTFCGGIERRQATTRRKFSRCPTFTSYRLALESNGSTQELQQRSSADGKPVASLVPWPANPFS